MARNGLGMNVYECTVKQTTNGVIDREFENDKAEVFPRLHSFHFCEP